MRGALDVGIYNENRFWGVGLDFGFGNIELQFCGRSGIFRDENNGASNPNQSGS